MYRVCCPNHVSKATLKHFCPSAMRRVCLSIKALQQTAKIAHFLGVYIGFGWGKYLLCHVETVMCCDELDGMHDAGGGENLAKNAW